LFGRSNAFSIDFDMFSASEWSFPLPIGKAKVSDDYKIMITSRKGDNVKSMFDGVVRLSRNNPSYGNVIVVRHKNGLETVYGHNAQNMVKVGDRVKAGQTIAIIGSEGRKSLLPI
jgi:murein DD-endopeptidase MepM/ murein hydrolase activator NlpD